MTNQEFENYKIKIIKIIEIFFPNAKIFLFGSYARGDFSAQSDIDIAIDNIQQIPLENKWQIMNMIEALNIPRKIDVIDLNAVPAELKNNVLKEGIIWKS